MISRHLNRISTVALAAFLVLGQPAVSSAHPLIVPAAADPASEPSESVTWALQPASGEGADGRVSLRHAVDPGGSVDEYLALTNYSGQPADFAVYASDGTVGADGSFDLISPDEESVGSGSWVALAAPDGAQPRAEGGFVATVPADSTVVIPVQIAVPADATPGDHPAGIVAELIPAAATEVHLASRIGVRVHLRVSGDIVAGIHPQNVTSTYVPSWNPFAPGTMIVDYSLVNSGNVRLGADSIVSITGPFGVLPAESPAVDKREILPQQSVEVSAQFPVWPLFLAEGTASAAPKVVGGDTIENQLDSSAESFSAWTVPWAQLCLLVLLVLGVFGIRRWREHSAVRVQARIDAAVAAAQSSPVLAETPAQTES
ncbi:COG1470 family protein [Microbacterium sp. A94]|uniref:COG1470 family protein n=1 Tax=Microbacterium sp. A94 TaxID=3450717 RepID=UPI003F43AB5A